MESIKEGEKHALMEQIGNCANEVKESLESLRELQEGLLRQHEAVSGDEFGYCCFGIKF